MIVGIGFKNVHVYSLIIGFKYVPIKKVKCYPTMTKKTCPSSVEFGGPRKNLVPAAP